MARGRLRDFINDLVDDGDGNDEGVLREVVGRLRGDDQPAAPAAPPAAEAPAPIVAPAPPATELIDPFLDDTATETAPTASAPPAVEEPAPPLDEATATEAAAAVAAPLEPTAAGPARARRDSARDDNADPDGDGFIFGTGIEGQPDNGGTGETPTIDEINLQSADDVELDLDPDGEGVLDSTFGIDGETDDLRTTQTNVRVSRINLQSADDVIQEEDDDFGAGGGGDGAERATADAGTDEGNDDASGFFDDGDDDGIPNVFDLDRDNDGVLDFFDGDVGNDGVLDDSVDD